MPPCLPTPTHLSLLNLNFWSFFFLFFLHNLWLLLFFHFFELFLLFLFKNLVIHNGFDNLRYFFRNNLELFSLLFVLKLLRILITLKEIKRIFKQLHQFKWLFLISCTLIPIDDRLWYFSWSSLIFFSWLDNRWLSIILFSLFLILQVKEKFRWRCSLGLVGLF